MFTPHDLARPLAKDGYALVSREHLLETLALDDRELEMLKPSWERLPRDVYLRDGGRYRCRRHACFIQTLSEKPNDSSSAIHELQRVPHRAHWQPKDYNALHGGIERWFDPIEKAVTSVPVWSQLLVGLGHVFASLAQPRRWYIEAHQFRIDTADGIGRPTPEGAHRDGVDFVAVILVERRDVRGGETRVFEAAGSTGVRFTMQIPWTTLLLDDARVIHETTPIQPAARPGVRDTLVLTYRANGFQAPPR
jgi:hypothetical protein